MKCRFDPWVRKFPQRRKWQPNPIFLPRNPMSRGDWWATLHGVAKSQGYKDLGTRPRVQCGIEDRKGSSHEAP